MLCVVVCSCPGSSLLLTYLNWLSFFPLSRNITRTKAQHQFSITMRQLFSLQLLLLLLLLLSLPPLQNAAYNTANPRCATHFFELRSSSSDTSSSAHRRFLSETTSTTTTTTTSSSADNHSSATATTQHHVSTSRNITYSSGTHAHASAQEVGYFALCLFIGILTKKCIAPKLCFNVFPYTVLLMMVGLFVGILSIYTQWDDSKQGGLFENMNYRCHLGSKQSVEPHGCDLSLSNDHCACRTLFEYFNVNVLHDISPHVILYVFLPPLIFESAFFMDIHIFVRSFRGVLSLAVVGVTVSTLITGFFLQYVMVHWSGSCVDYSPFANFDTAMMMGAMLSATDPVAVVGILKSLGASPQLGTLIEGESLLNDGTAYAMFLIFQARSEFAEVFAAMPESTCLGGDNISTTVNECAGLLENSESGELVATVRSFSSSLLFFLFFILLLFFLYILCHFFDFWSYSHSHTHTHTII